MSAWHLLWPSPGFSGLAIAVSVLGGSFLYLCYIDESGTAQVLNPDVPDSVPVMVIGGFTVPEERMTALASDFIELKKRFRPELRTRPTLRDVVHHEVKGETLRKSFRRTGRKQRRAAHGFLDYLLNLTRATPLHGVGSRLGEAK